jgi:hypothetical protein
VRLVALVVVMDNPVLLQADHREMLVVMLQMVRPIMGLVVVVGLGLLE